MRTGNLAALFLIVFSTRAAFAIEPTPPDPSEPPDYARTGIYAGVGATFAPEIFHDVGSTSTGDSWGANFHVGYRVLPRLAMELQAEWAEGFNLGGRDVTTWAVMTNAKAYFLRSRIQPFLLLGAGFLNASGAGADGTGFAGRVGAGLEFWFTEHIAALAEVSYVGTTGAVSDLDYGSVVWGLQYRF